jgi:divalent metal cation (Fe/Co/Zn/Cd) transporter
VCRFGGCRTPVRTTRRREDHAVDYGERAGIEVRKASETISLVRSVGECFVSVPSDFLVAINIAVDPQTPVIEGRHIVDRVAEAVRSLNPNIRHLFVQVLPDEKLF